MQNEVLTPLGQKRLDFEMKIAYLLFDPGVPVGGTKGASIHVKEFCVGASRLGHEVHLLATNVVGDIDHGVIVHDLGVSVASKAERDKIDAAVAFSKVASIMLERIQPDLIYERLSLFFGDGPSIAASLGIQRILEINAPIADERIKHFGLNLVAEARREELRAISKSDVVVVSGALKHYAKSNGAREILVAQNGVDSARFVVFAHNNILPVICFVGSLKPWHGVANLIRATKILLNAGFDHSLQIIGDGPEFHKLNLLVTELGLGDHVEFVGAVNSCVIPSYLGKVDIAVAPYLVAPDFYFSPLKLLEYMSCGIPFVATRTSSIQEITGDYPYLIDDPSPRDIASMLSDILCNLPGAKRVAQRARERIVEQFDWSVVVEKIFNFASTINHQDKADAALEISI